MKKLGIVAALALATTVGGVYAAWQYAGESAASDVSGTKDITITQGELKGQSGKLNLTLPTSLKIDNMGGYVPGWSDTDCAGNLTITFTPEEGAPNATFEYTITITGNTFTDNEKGAVKILDVANDTITGTFTYTAGDAEAVKTWDIDQVKAMFPVNGDVGRTNQFDIGTYAEYLEYSAAVTAMRISVTVKQVS